MSGTKIGGRCVATRGGEVYPDPARPGLRRGIPGVLEHGSNPPPSRPPHPRFGWVSGGLPSKGGCNRRLARANRPTLPR